MTVKPGSTAIEAPVRAERLQFIDNIRWVLIALVIVHHSAVTYSHLGSWYYMDGPKPGLLTTLILAAFLSFNQAYFMGFLFLIAAYFAAPAFDRERVSDVCTRPRRAAWLTFAALYAGHPPVDCVLAFA